jgi:hypothetical protein
LYRGIPLKNAHGRREIHLGLEWEVENELGLMMTRHRLRQRIIQVRKTRLARA